MPKSEKTNAGIWRIALDLWKILRNFVKEKPEISSVEFYKTYKIYKIYKLR